MSFTSQIREDIKFYQKIHPFVANIDKDEWAFNYWVLDKLYCEDEDEIENKIIDYSDHGIDCYVWHEESKDLYLIQNKYFLSDGSSIDSGYFNDAVQDGYGQLVNGTYSRCPDLQTIFSKFKVDPEFYVYHYFYITNNVKSENVAKAVQDFNQKNSDNQRYAKIFYLDDIEEAYYGEPITPKKHLRVELKTKYKGMRLVVNNQDYGLTLPIDAEYIMLPVVTLYDALLKAEDENYPIFDANIREYLGTTKQVNKGIINTLKSETERKKFFFYNNGITIICTSILEKTVPSGRRITIDDPQIVNGCQTVSSIKRVLEGVPQRDLEKDFEDVYVMAKVLVVPNDNEEMEGLRKSIVKYNNSQNSIDTKTFTAVEDLFKRVQSEFEDYGFLVKLKQSDKNTFSEEFKTPTILKQKAFPHLKRFGLEDTLITTAQFMVDLDKLLQVVLAFAGDAQQAFQKKGNLLKKDSPQYKLVTTAIRNPELTTRRLLDLYLLYLLSESMKKENAVDGKIPITWYLMEGFSKIECQGGDFGLIDDYLEEPDSINRIARLYKGATQAYLQEYVENHNGKEYNSMIKEPLDMAAFKKCRRVAEATLG